MGKEICSPEEAKAFYDRQYRNSQHFKYRRWLYRPFVQALITKAGLSEGSRVLDAGCGQGFFSSLFREFGLRPVGVDCSSEAIQAAEREYGSAGSLFQVGDVMRLEQRGAFDCVFARGLSLYNVDDLEHARTATETFLSYLKPNGVLIFSHPTNYSPRKQSKTWRPHSLADVQSHFSAYAGARVYFTLRLETCLLGDLAFHSQCTRTAAHISTGAGIGGELIAFVPAPEQL